MLKSYFNLTKKERKGSLYFVLFMGCLFSVNLLITDQKGTVVTEITSQEVAAIQGATKESSFERKKVNTSRVDKNVKPKIKASKSKLVVEAYFDPNQLTEQAWQSMGLSPKQAATAMRFIKSKGGLTRASELSELYVMSKQDKELLVNWCRIEQKPINDWNEDDFKKIKGVGEKLSSRVVKYRDKLGGFYDLQQLNEVYGLGDEVVSRIAERGKLSSVLLLEINQLTYSQLSKHPYISKSEAKMIIKMRSIEPFSRESQLFKVFSEKDKVKRLLPYISYE